MMNRTVTDGMMRSGSQYSRRSEIEEFLELESKVWNRPGNGGEETRKNSNFSIRLKRTKLSGKKKKNLLSKKKGNDPGKRRNRKSPMKMRDGDLSVNKSRNRKKDLRRMTQNKSKKRLAERKLRTKSSRTQDKVPERSVMDRRSRSRVRLSGKKRKPKPRTPLGSSAKKGRGRGRSKSKVLYRNDSKFGRDNDLRSLEAMSLRGETPGGISDVETSKFLNFHDLDKSLLEGVKTRIEDDEESFVSIVDNKESLFGTVEKKKKPSHKNSRDTRPLNLGKLDQYYEDQISSVGYL